jgi:tetratricopeptide (TPR) repeat protein
MVVKIKKQNCKVLNPSNAEAYMWYGSILLNSGEYSDGMKLRKKAYEIDPQAAVVGFNRAEDLIRQGDYKSAMNVFNNIVRNNPNYENAYSIAGEISLTTGDLEQAYVHFKKAKDLGGNEWMWRLKSNKIYLPIGDFEKAQSNLDYLVSNKSKLTQSKIVEHYLQPELWLASGQIDEIKKWVSSFDKESDKWHERLWRGYFALDAEKWKEAIGEFEFVLQIIDKQKNHKDPGLLIRTNLLLSKGWKQLGDSIKSENYVNIARSKIDYLVTEQKFNPIKFRYEQAAIANLSGNQLESLNLLKQAVQEGFVEIWNLKMDPLFNNLRSDPIYIDLIVQLEEKLDVFKKSIDAVENPEFASL